MDALSVPPVAGKMAGSRNEKAASISLTACSLWRRDRACPVSLAHTTALDFRSRPGCAPLPTRDRKSTRLNSSHLGISYAVFCLQKKYTTDTTAPHPTLLLITHDTHSTSLST